jgi:hypothetical protein
MNKSPKEYLQSKVHEFPKARFRNIKWIRSTNNINNTVSTTNDKETKTTTTKTS